jgi:DNA-damage-inducible protein D
MTKTLVLTLIHVRLTKDMRRRDPELAKGWGQIVSPLSVETSGRNQKLNCSNTEGIFRIIQSVPSPKAEPFISQQIHIHHDRREP